MNTAKTIIDTRRRLPEKSVSPPVGADTPVVELLDRLLESPDHTLRVLEGERELGLLTETLLLEGLAREFGSRGETAMLTVRCHASDYSASRIAIAVEDAGCHLTDMWSSPSDDGSLTVTLRVGCQDPSPVIHSLERYGFEVEGVYANNYADAAVAGERLLALQSYLNV